MLGEGKIEVNKHIFHFTLDFSWHASDKSVSDMNRKGIICLTAKMIFCSGSRSIRQTEYPPDFAMVFDLDGGSGLTGFWLSGI